MTTFVEGVEPQNSIKTKRFLVFVGHDAHPGGGWNDFIGSADTFDDAVAAAKAVDYEWFQVVDVESGLLVA
jgi:hypothetical protein